MECRTLKFYLEIKDAELSGGEGTVCYAEANYEIPLESMSTEECERLMGKLMEIDAAHVCEVPTSKVRVITRKEFQKHTEDD